MTTTRTNQELILTVCQDRGDIGVAVCIAKPPKGKKINSSAVQDALEHVHSSSDVILGTQVGLSYMTCEVPLPVDEDENMIDDHVLAIMQCMLAGIEDYLAETGEEFLLDTKLASDRDRELVGSMSD